MRCERGDYVKWLFTAHLIAVLVLLFHFTQLSARKKPPGHTTGLTKAAKNTSGDYITSTKIFRGLHTVTLRTKWGKINFNLPADMASCEKISNTVCLVPSGREGNEIPQNLGELKKYVVEIEEIKNKQMPAAQRQYTWTVPSAINALHLVFKDKNGIEVGRTEVPVCPGPPVFPPPDFQIPTIGQTGYTDFLEISGPFDGDFKSTRVRIGDSNAKLLAESPWKLIVKIPPGITGQTNITLDERGIKVESKFHCVSVNFDFGKKSLQRGETTWMRVTVKAKVLDKFRDNFSLRLKNNSPINLSIEGGNIQIVPISFKDVNPDGTYSFERTLTGKLPGTSLISARISHGINYPLYQISEILDEFQDFIRQDISDMRNFEYHLARVKKHLKRLFEVLNEIENSTVRSREGNPFEQARWYVNEMKKELNVLLDIYSRLGMNQSKIEEMENHKKKISHLIDRFNELEFLTRKLLPKEEEDEENEKSVTDNEKRRNLIRAIRETLEDFDKYISAIDTKKNSEVLREAEALKMRPPAIRKQISDILRTASKKKEIEARKLSYKRAADMLSDFRFDLSVFKGIYNSRGVDQAKVEELENYMEKIHYMAVAFRMFAGPPY